MEAEWLNKYFPAHEGKNQYTEVGTKTEPTKMPVPKKESARVSSMRMEDLDSY
jgi:hypothetical protein